jgi:hypothetical protein
MANPAARADRGKRRQSTLVAVAIIINLFMYRDGGGYFLVPRSDTVPFLKDNAGPSGRGFIKYRLPVTI